MRCLILRPLVLIATFTVGLFATFLFTFMGGALTQTLDEPIGDIPPLCQCTGADGLETCSRPTLQKIEEFAVYSTLLIAMYDGGHSDRILIRDHTSVDNLEYKAIASPLESLRLQNPLVQRKTLDSFRAENEQSCPLYERFSVAGEQSSPTDERFRLPGMVRWITEREIQGYFSEGGGRWQAFNRDYQNAGGFVTLSKVGFNRDMNQALVYLASSCGDTCGLGSLVFLVEEGNTWKIKGTTAAWVS